MRCCELLQLVLLQRLLVLEIRHSLEYEAVLGCDVVEVAAVGVEVVVLFDVCADPLREGKTWNQGR